MSQGQAVVHGVQERRTVMKKRVLAVISLFFLHGSVVLGQGLSTGVSKGKTISMTPITIGKVKVSGEVRLDVLSIVRDYDPNTKKWQVDWRGSLAEGTYKIRVTKGDLSKEMSGEIYDLGEIFIVERKGDAVSVQKAPILKAAGKFLCVHPDYQKKPIVDPAKGWVKHLELKCRDAKTLEFSDDVIVSQGIFGLAARTSTATGEFVDFDFSAIFLEGAKWKIAKPLKFGYEDKKAKSVRILAPGSYILGKHGIPVRAANEKEEAESKATSK